VRMDWWTAYQIKMWVPIFVALALTLISCVATWRKNSVIIRPEAFLASLLSYLMFVIVAFYSFLTSVALAPFNCTKVGTNTIVLVSSAEVVCYDSAWKSHLGEAIFFMLTYFLACPLIIIWILFKCHQLNKMNSTFKRVVREHAYQEFAKPYRRRFYYWELVTTFKRVLLVFCFTFFDSLGYSAKIVLSVLLLFIFAWIESMTIPYLRRNWTKISWNIILVLILLCQGILFELKSSDPNSISDGAIGFLVALIIIMILACLLTNSLHLATKLFDLGKWIPQPNPNDSKKIPIPTKIFKNLSDDDQAELVHIHNESILRTRGFLKLDLQVVRSCLDEMRFEEFMQLEEDFISVPGHKRKRGASFVEMDGRRSTVRSPTIVRIPVHEVKEEYVAERLMVLYPFLPQPEAQVETLNLNDEDVIPWGKYDEDLPRPSAVIDQPRPSETKELPKLSSEDPPRPLAVEAIGLSNPSTEVLPRPSQVDGEDLPRPSAVTEAKESPKLSAGMRAKELPKLSLSPEDLPKPSAATVAKDFPSPSVESAASEPKNP
jgi:hypothetical protein